MERQVRVGMAALVAMWVVAASVAVNADVYWLERFNASAVDLGVWDEMNKPDWGAGRVRVLNGYARFEGEPGKRLHYPTLITKASPFPAAGDWLLQYRMGWHTPVTAYGNGLMASEGLQGTDWHVVRVAQTWRDTSGLRMFGQAWSHLWGEPGSSTEWHVCSVRKAGAQYSYYVDGQLVGTEPATRTPNLIVLGNAGGMASDWSDFKVDYVTILAPGAPTLEWTTGVGFAADGVSPEGGHEGDSFEFRARYVDLDGDRPDRGVRLRLFRNGVEVGNSPFGTTRVGGDINGDGLVYSRTRPLSAGRYTYSFEATGNGEPATGPASLLNPGPVVTSPPKLYAPKFSPAAGGAATKYRFRVRYRTSDGLPAQWVQLQLRVQTPTSGWTTHVYRKYDRAAGTLAHWTLRLGQLYPDATAFRHRYRAYKVVGPIRDLATTAWTNGPTVNSSTSAPLTMTSAAAQATNGGGAEIMFRLSAPGGVTATVLNVAGREVRTLSTVDAEAGLQRVLWDGRSDSGLGVPAGRYVVRIEARSESGELARAMTALSIRR